MGGCPFTYTGFSEFFYAAKQRSERDMDLGPALGFDGAPNSLESKGLDSNL